ncbi:MAG TPA: metal ABC transporter permease [Opitutaceae bacterium]
MSDLIPAFDFHRVFIAPWTENADLFGWVGLMGFFVAAACGLVGNYLILRRMALMGDAVSHSVLPGLVIAFLFSGSRGTLPMFLGALAAGLVTTVIIEIIHKKTRVKQDAAIGIAFSTLFAIGVVLVSVYARQVDLDADCVLYGEISYVSEDLRAIVGGVSLGPESVVRMGAVLVGVGVLIVLFYKELLVSAFDPGLARSLGVNPSLMHYGLMAVLSIVVVSAFEAVGAILVIAMLILPGATGALLTTRLPVLHALAVVHAALSAWLGVTLGVWLDTSIAPAMVVAGTGLFALAWVFSPTEGLIARWRRSGRTGGLQPTALDSAG